MARRPYPKTPLLYNSSPRNKGRPRLAPGTTVTTGEQEQSQRREAFLRDREYAPEYDVYWLRPGVERKE